MKLQEAKSLFTAGALKSPAIVPAPMREAWHVQASANRGAWKAENLVAKSGKVREFKTVEAALRLLSEIGFKQASITFD